LENSSPDDIQTRIENLISSALPSLNPPFVANVDVSSTTEDSTTITWSTNVPAYGAVSYGPEEDFAKTKLYSAIVSEGDSKGTGHKVTLTGLTPNTVYHFAIKSFVFQQIPGVTEDATFITKAPSIQAQVLEVTKDSFHVVWTSTEKTSSIVEYRRAGAAEFNKKTDDTLATTHDVLIDNLAPTANYEVKVSGVTAEGNLVGAKQNLTVTTRQDIPPVITSFKVNSALVPGGTNRIQTVVTWDTDEAATSIVHYEEGSGASDTALANKQEDENLTLSHVIVLTDLKPGTIYRFQIESTDNSGNITKLPVRTIITPQQGQSIVDVIVKNFGDTFKFLNPTR